MSALLNEDDRLRVGNLKALAAAHVLAGEHVVYAHHVVARLLKACAVKLVCAARAFTLLRALEPAHIVVVALAAMRARETRALGFLLFVKEIFFVHKKSGV